MKLSDKSKMQKTDPRSAVMMYEERDEYIEDDIASYLKKRCEVLERKYGLQMYAFIHHDKDEKDDRKVAPHYHLTLYFGKSRPAVSSIAKVLGTTSSQIEVMTKRGTRVDVAKDNAFMYLIHATREARREEKYQYSPKEVVANFDYIKFAEKNISKDTPEKILEDLGNGRITRTAARSRMMEFGAATLAKYKRKIDDIAEASLSIEYAHWRTDHEENHMKIMVFWFCGETGTGKTLYAKHLAKFVFKMPYFVSGGRRDAMQDYEGEHLIIWDELRDDIEYSELLRLLDPFNYDKAVSSRYYNKNLMPDIIIITSPYRPDELYEVMNVFDRKKDRVDQLARRVPTVYCFEKEKVRILQWDTILHEYVSSSETLPSAIEMIEQENETKKQPLEPFYGLDEYVKEEQQDGEKKTTVHSPKPYGDHHDSI